MTTRPNDDRQQQRQNDHDSDADDSSSVSSESSDEYLNLQGQQQQQQLGDDSSTTSLEDNAPKKRPAHALAKQPKQKQAKSDDDLLNVEFTFSEMKEAYFHGVKSLLISSSSVYQSANVSAITESILEYKSIGTILSMDDGQDNVFGFASILNGSLPSLESLGQAYMKGTQKQPFGVLMQARMMNVPLNIVVELHQQIGLDWEWALSEQEVEPYKTLIRLAPCAKETNNDTKNNVVYKYFDDEVLAEFATCTHLHVAPKLYSKESTDNVNVLMLTEERYKAAVQKMQTLL